MSSIKDKSDWIFGHGAGSAKLMLVGEAPGKHEDLLRKPFVGPAGELVTELLETAGISRSSVYITNVVKLRPPDNDLERLCEIGNPDRNYDSPEGIGYKIDDFLPLLWNEIQTIRPNCILALGSVACEVLTGKKGIKNYRGSILPLQNDPSIKVIPTIHPAALFEHPGKGANKQGMFSWKQKSHIQFDFIKAARECQSPEFNTLIRNLEIIKTSLQLDRFFNMYRDFNLVYVDTEVFKATLVCIGFAFTPTHGISIPLLNLQSNENHTGINLQELVDIWKIVAEKLYDPNLKKGGQNFKADKVYWLEKAGFTVNGFAEEAMFKLHTISPELPKSLAFQCSLYTNEPYYKSEGKEYNPYKDRLDVLLKYNAKDCVINCECDMEMNKDLKELGLEDFYYNFVMPLYPIYEKIEKKGILVDKRKKKELSEHLGALLLEKKAERLELFKDFGIDPDTLDPKLHDLNYQSWKQVDKLVYTILKCPRRADTSDKTLTALMNNAVKDSRKKKIIANLLDSRSIDKLKEVYVDCKEDYDGRMRTSINQVGAETGRTSTSIIQKPLRNGKWGVPFQTVPRLEEYGANIKQMYIPDPGMIFIEFDQSQAEARIVALEAGDEELLELFDILDVHKLTASFCYKLSGIYTGAQLIKSALYYHNHPFASMACTPNFKAPEYVNFKFLEQVTEVQRQVGKQARHGLGFGLGEEGLSIKMRISMWAAKEAYKKVHEMSPKIKEVYHEAVQELMARGRVMITPFGRRREFFNRWGNELFREAYAHIPQSTVADNTKRAMLLLEKEKVDWIQILQEGHDAFLAQIPENRIEECYHIVKPIFELPLDFERCSIPRRPLVIPIDCKVGENWGDMKKVKFN